MNDQWNGTPAERQAAIAAQQNPNINDPYAQSGLSLDEVDKRLRGFYAQTNQGPRPIYSIAQETHDTRYYDDQGTEVDAQGVPLAPEIRTVTLRTPVSKPKGFWPWLKSLWAPTTEAERKRWSIQ